MDTKDLEFETQSDGVMKEIGKLDALTKELKDADAAEEEDRKSIADWITTVGKAILAIFK